MLAILGCLERFSSLAYAIMFPFIDCQDTDANAFPTEVPEGSGIGKSKGNTSHAILRTVEG